jgi:hypothetical protein
MDSLSKGHNQVTNASKVTLKLASAAGAHGMKKIELDRV